MLLRVLFLSLLLLFLPDSVLAQDDPGASDETITSMGIPKKTVFYGGGVVTYDNSMPGDREWGGQLFGGVYKPLKNPMFGFGVAGELYAGVLDSDSDLGLRLFGVVKVIYSSFGVDYSERLDSWDFIWTFNVPLKRGGLFGMGDTFRIDWIPGRGDTFNFGLTFPLFQPYQGKTRDKDDRVTVPSRPWKFSTSVSDNAEFERLYELTHHAADWVNIYTTPFFDQGLGKDEAELDEFRGKVERMKSHLQRVDQNYPQGHSFQAEIDNYHRFGQELFAVAMDIDADSDLAAQTWDAYRAAITKNVLLPYDRLLGRSKRNDNLLGLGVTSGEQFQAWLDRQRVLTDQQREAAWYTHNRFIRSMDVIRQGALATWKSSQFVWLPLHWGYKPDEVDERDEFDRLLEQVTNDEFVLGNRTWYVINEQFHSQVAQSIFEAEDYHVLWIHDFTGLNHDGEPDSVAGRFTSRVYLPALTAAVKRYDETGKLTTYMMMLSQWFFLASNSYLYTQLLQDPLRFELDLPEGFEEWEREIAAAQEDLRRAVAASQTLQKQRAMFGDDWLYNKVKVHVNVTYRNDWSFRTSQVISGLFIVPDNLIVDHRKLAFWDVSEEDVSKGGAVFSGMGIGEHYTGPTWEDRGVMIEGPVLLGLRDQARFVLEQQGFAPDQIPPPLRPKPFPADHEERLAELQKVRWATAVMDVHNITGFGPKPIAAMKATFYSMMPPGSVMVVPDSLWNASLWGGMLAGAALRGATVMPIVPSLDNAPSAGFPQMSRAFELFSRLVMVSLILEDEIEAAGGRLKVGVYNRQTEVADTPGKVREFMAGVEKYPFLKEVFPFPDDVYAAMLKTADEIEAEGFKATYFTEDAHERRPKLHLKINYFGAGELKNLMRIDGWENLFPDYLRSRTNFTARTEALVDIRDVDQTLDDATFEFLRAYAASVPEEQRALYLSYLLVGSHNQDYRGIITDGEISLVITRASSLAGLVDVFFMSGLTEWVDTVERLEALLPPQSGWRRSFGRYITKAL